MEPTKNIYKRRLIWVFVFSSFLVCVMAFRVGWIQIVDQERYEKLAIEQQTRDDVIPAKRGDIYDRNGKELAINTVTYSIWVRPAKLLDPRSKKSKNAQLEETAKGLSDILKVDEKEILSKIKEGKVLIKVAKFVDKNKTDKIQKKRFLGVEITKEVKRCYPMGAFASQVLGSTTDDNRGLAGIELQYNRYLSGTAGRVIKNTDRNGGSLAYGREDYFAAKNGLSLVLTIDVVIQHYVEDAIAHVQENTQADRVMCIMMDPKTGDILAMGMTPGYNPNNPRVPIDPAQAAYVESLSDDQKLNYWNKMWRNPMVNDTYEPGSTFKILTTAMALEEGVTTPNESFYDPGYIMVAGTKLKCWQYPKPHGQETLTQAFGVSCNPVFVQLAQRIGYDKYFDYLEQFGLKEKTGIDYPGEGTAILQNKEKAGPVGLATMGFGQGIAVTPIQLITAISALGNDGKMMQPRLVKEMRDENGHVAEKFDSKIVRQIISKQTADEVNLMMEAEVAEYGGGAAKVPGYRIGGKTGTAQKAVAGGYSNETYSSFIGMAPIDDPKVSILLIVDNPKGVKYGSLVAAPGVKEILENTLRYMNVKPSNPTEVYSKDGTPINPATNVMVPDIVNMKYSQAVQQITSAKLKCIISPAPKNNNDFVVVDQYPKAGTVVTPGDTVYVYWK